MPGRRTLYAALLIGAAVLHIAYGQYVTHLILFFIVILPVISLLLALPAVFSSRTELIGCEDVEQGNSASVRLITECDSKFITPAAWKIRIERRNIFTGEKPNKTKLLLRGGHTDEEAFIPDTDRIGAVKCRILSAKVCDPMGLFALPVRKSGDITFLVLPREEAPVPEPDLIRCSGTVTRPMPGGFSEEHELRPYREGDPVNLIHWKLTLKMNDPIVREPQQVLYKDIILSADLPNELDRAERVFAIFVYLGRKLCLNSIPFVVHFGGRIAPISSITELERFISFELSKPYKPQKALPAKVGSDTVIYRIAPGEGGKA